MKVLGGCFKECSLVSQAHVPAPRQPALDFKSYRTRRAMLGRTPNLADPLAKTANQALLGKQKPRG